MLVYLLFMDGYWFCMGILVPIGFVYLRDFPGNGYAGMGCHFLLHQGSFQLRDGPLCLLCLLPCRQVLYPLHIQKPILLKTLRSISVRSWPAQLWMILLSSWNYFSDILARGKSQMCFAPSTFTLI